jgi:hypothetical protein
MSAILLIPYALLVSSRRAILSTAAACALDFVDLLQRIAALAARTTRTTISQPQHRPCIKDIRNKTRSINRGALQECLQCTRQPHSVASHRLICTRCNHHTAANLRAQYSGKRKNKMPRRHGTCTLHKPAASRCQPTLTALSILLLSAQASSPPHLGAPSACGHLPTAST